MRVYEFAKQEKLSSKELLAILNELGFNLASHMSVLPDEAVEALTKKFSKAAPKKSAPQKTTAPKKAPAPNKAVPPKPVEKKPVVKKEAKKPVIKKAPTVPKKVFPKRQRPSVPEIVEVSEITVVDDTPLFQVARMMGKTEGEVILELLKKGLACNRNHLLPVSLISDLAHHFGIKIITPEREDTLVAGRLAVEEATAAGKGDTRWPIVVVMGHVDHGKTSLLDYVRKMNTAARERGGITQHLSAYEVDSVHGKIVFLDTPGHEAFSYMRKRGASVTDIVVLVVAADDGVMPQTVEVISHAKAADVPIVVAINKIDKVDAASAVERVKRQLAQHDLLPEDWGGSVICVPISAKTGEGVEELLEMITLQAQMMELKADRDAPARGFILESHQEKGLGPVATVICLSGTIKIGDFFVCGSSVGRVRLLIDCFGKRIQCAGPSIPVQVVGFDNFVSLGDWLTIVSREEYLREKSSRKKESTERTMRERDEHAIPLLIKVDTHGSREAVLGAIKKINKSHPEIPNNFSIIHAGIGDISERDIELAAHVGAYVIGLHVKVEKNAISVAREQKIAIKEFGIIYRMVEYLEELLKEHEEEIVVLKKVGEAIVKKVFDLKKKGVIAGCGVTDGVISRHNVVACIRDGEKIGESKIASLQRERKSVKEVHSGFECGFITENFHDWQVGDIVHAFVEEKKKRSEM
jgi:translation initiation factor IF-2